MVPRRKNLVISLVQTALLLACLFVDDTRRADPTPLMTINANDHSVVFSGTIHPGRFNAWHTWPKNHHFIVWREGRAARNALITADVNDLDVQRALEGVGARAGDNLTPATWRERGNASHPDPDLRVEGSLVDVSISWEEGGRLRAAEIFTDNARQGFNFRLGGGAALIPEFRSGCVVCLESCPGGRISNDRYTMRDYQADRATFRVRAGQLPPDGTRIMIRIVLVDQPRVAP